MSEKIKNKRINFGKKFLLLILFLSFIFSPNTQPAKAWDAIPAMLMDEAWRMMQDTIKGIQLGLAKQAAITALQQQVSFMITGRSSGGAMFVTDWNAFLVRQPQNQANIFINDYISQATRGRGSISGYIPAGFEGVGANFGFVSQMAQSAKNITSGQVQAQVTFRGDPSQIFAGQNPFQNLNLYLSGINNPWAFNVNVQQKYQEQLANQQLIAQTKGVAGQGFLGTEVNGQTVTPGAVVKDQLSAVQNMGLNVISNAKYLPEIISGAVSMTINKTMVNGIGSISASLTREVSNVRGNVTSQLNSAVQQAGPAALYNQIRR